MKKFFIYFFAFIFVCFVLPAILTNTKSVSNNENNKNIEEIIDGEEKQNEGNQSEEYSYKNYGTIKLLHKKTNEVEDVDLDTYLYSVVSSEMPASFEKEALKAQAIVARTYTVYKIKSEKHENADICDDSTCCQAWISKEDRLNKWNETERESNWNKIEECVNETKGKIITYNNEPINALFHANSGGTTELPVNVWGGSNLPYLQVVETAGEEGYSQYNSEVTVTQTELLEKLKSKYSDIAIDFSKDEDIQILEYTDSGRAKTVKFGNHNLSGVEVRTIFTLKSTNFEIIKQENQIKFSVKGYGHGVGMSQTGADSMAKQGENYEEIIKHFYNGIEIKDINLL